MSGPICEVQGCGRLMHAKGLCGAHYQQMRSGKDPHAAGPRPVSAPDWSPPKGLSAAWHEANRHRPQAPALREAPCALSACAGIALRGSDLCPAHDHWRASQARLRAKGLA